jgi:hypothetical protein
LRVTSRGLGDVYKRQAIHTPNVITIEKIIFVDCMYKITIYLFNSMPCIFMVFPNDTSISIDYRSTKDLIQKRVPYNHDIISVNAKLVGVYHNLLRSLKIVKIHIKN